MGPSPKNTHIIMTAYITPRQTIQIALVTFIALLISSLTSYSLANQQDLLSEDQFSIETLLKSSDIWIDSDPGCHLSGWHDIDDCIALALLLKHNQLRIKGISTVFGNTTQSIETSVLEEILSYMNLSKIQTQRQTEIFKGASQPIERSGADTPASNALIRTLENEKLSIVALGPLTNIAKALQSRPDLSSQIKFIAYLGGTYSSSRLQLPEQHFLHFHDLNVLSDVNALQTVLINQIPLFLISFTDIVSIRASAKEVIDALIPNNRLKMAIIAWEQQWEKKLGVKGFVPFDLVLAGLIAHPEHYRCSPVEATVIDPQWSITRYRHRLVIELKDNLTGIWRCIPHNNEVLSYLLAALKAEQIKSLKFSPSKSFQFLNEKN
jgi:purine nucleosidase